MLFFFINLRLRGRYNGLMVNTVVSKQKGPRFLNSSVKLHVKIGAPLGSLSLTQSDPTGL